MILTCKNILAKHWLLFFLAVLVGAIHVFPHGYLFWKLYPNYTPLTVDQRRSFSSYETTYAYASEVNQILQGNWPVADGQSYEYRNLPSPFMGETLPATVLAIIAKLFNSIDSAVIISSAIFPVLAFLLTYFVFRELGVKNFSAQVGSIFVLIFRDLPIYLPYPAAVFKFLQNFSSYGYLPMNRSFTPQITFVLLMLSVLMFMRLINKPSVWWVILGGLVIGSLYYTYLFNWTAVIFATGLFFIFSKIDKKLLVAAVTLSFVIGLPYFINVYQFRQLPQASDFSIKSSYPVFQFYLPTLKYTLVALVLVFLGFWKQQKKRLIILLAAAALILPTLSQLILGRDLEGNHWITRIVLPLELLAIWVVVSQKIKLLNAKVILSSLLIFTLALAVLRQLVTAETTQAAFTNNKEEKQVFDFLNTSTPKDSVVASLSFSENIMLSVYTHNRLYIPRGDRTLIPVAENLERFLLLCKYYQIKPGQLDMFFDTSDRSPMRGSDGSGVAQIFALSIADQGRNLAYNDQLRQKVKIDYQNILAASPLGIKKYRVDYLLVGPLERNLGTKLTMSPDKLELVYSNSSYSVYQVL